MRWLGLAVLVLSIGACRNLVSRDALLQWEFGPWGFTDLRGIRVAPNGFPIDETEFSTVVAETILVWEDALAADGSTCDLSAFGPHYAVAFTENPFKTYRIPGYTLLGMTGYCGGLLFSEVGYATPLAKTALGHEIGHAVLFYCGLSLRAGKNIEAQEDLLSYWHKRYGVPF